MPSEVSGPGLRAWLRVPPAKSLLIPVSPALLCSALSLLLGLGLPHLRFGDLITWTFPYRPTSISFSLTEGEMAFLFMSFSQLQKVAQKSGLGRCCLTLQASRGRPSTASLLGLGSHSSWHFFFLLPQGSLLWTHIFCSLPLSRRSWRLMCRTSRLPPWGCFSS